MATNQPMRTAPEDTVQKSSFAFDADAILAIPTRWGTEAEPDEELWRVVGRGWRLDVSFAHGRDDESSGGRQRYYRLENRRGKTKRVSQADLLAVDCRQIHPSALNVLRDEEEEGDDAE